MTTREQWAQDLLTEAGWSLSIEKIDALVAQASKEDTGAANNPIATTEPAPGATDFNSAGVKNYPAYIEGLAATVATLRNGRYSQLVGVLSDPSGGSAVTYCTSAELNTWGTGNCLSFLESIKSGDLNGYLTHKIAGGGLPSPPSPSPPPAPSPTIPTKEQEMTAIIINGVPTVFAEGAGTRAGQLLMFQLIPEDPGVSAAYWSCVDVTDAVGGNPPYTVAS